MRYLLDVGISSVSRSVCPPHAQVVFFRDGRLVLTVRGELVSPVLDVRDVA